MVCKKAPGEIARQHVLNDTIWRAFGATGIPAVKQPSGVDRQDGKRQDGLTLIPWQGGCSLGWDVTVASQLAASYVDRAATDAGTVADKAASRKPSAVTYEPIAVENLAAISSSVLDFLLELGRRVYSQSEGVSESLYLFQRISVAIQRFNSVLLHDTLTVDIPDTE